MSRDDLRGALILLGVIAAGMAVFGVALRLFGLVLA